MAYLGMYIDRCNRIRPAGVVDDRKYGVKELLVHASLDDKVTALKHEDGIFNDEETSLSAPKKYAQPPDSGTRYEGVYTQMRDIVSPPRGTDFQIMRRELMETSYPYNYWNAPTGKSRYQACNLPGGFDYLTRTLGMPRKKEPSMAELVSPQKLPGQVLFEHDFVHDLYVKSHKDYDPGEQVSRNYLPETYDPTLSCGVRRPSDRRGIHVPRCLHWFNNEPFSFASNKQTENVLHSPQIGKCLVRGNILGCKVPEDQTFGTPTLPSEAGVRELIHYSGNPSHRKRDEADYFSHINSVRYGLLKNKEFDWKGFEGRFRFYDKTQSGLLPLETFYSVCMSFRVNFEKPLLEKLLKRLGMLKENQCVDYQRFAEMLNANYAFPKMPNKILGVPLKDLHYDTTYSVSYMPTASKEVRAAGVPTTRNDLKYPTAVINAYKESLSDETDVPVLINPSVMTIHGLGHRDVFQPLSLDKLTSLFSKMNVDIPEAVAKGLYEEGLKLDNTGGVCVETFKNLLERISARRLNDPRC